MAETVPRIGCGMACLTLAVGALSGSVGLVGIAVMLDLLKVKLDESLANASTVDLAAVGGLVGTLLAAVAVASVDVYRSLLASPTEKPRITDWEDHT